VQLVRRLITSPAGSIADRVVAAVGDVQAADDGPGEELSFSLRAATGARAEDAFRIHHELTGEPAPGELLDRRVDQCGFDFEIVTPAGSVYVEVKGLAGKTGGVTLTDREWQTAKLRGDAYVLAVVRDALTDPQVTLIRNPAARFSPEMRSYTLLQVGWCVSGAALKQAAPGSSSGSVTS
jgi:hypothetical protein